MAYAHKVVRCTLFGSMYSGAEIWSTGFYMGNEGSDAAEPTEAFADVVLASWQDFFTATNTSISFNWKTHGVKLALYNEDETTDTANVVQKTYTTAIAGQNGGAGFPPQVSLVASLLAGLGTQRGDKGRMFIPGVASGLDTTGHATTGYAQTIATNLKTFFDDLNGSFDAPGQLINASHPSSIPSGALPLNKLVTTIKVGNVYDTQRRRRNALAESYASATLT
jgi:hypothetical protein